MPYIVFTAGSVRLSVVGDGHIVHQDVQLGGVALPLYLQHRVIAHTLTGSGDHSRCTSNRYIYIIFSSQPVITVNIVSWFNNELLTSILANLTKSYSKSLELCFLNINQKKFTKHFISFYCKLTLKISTFSKDPFTYE